MNGEAPESEIVGITCDEYGNVEGIRVNKVIPKGAIFTVSSGEYSGHETLVVCRALVEINVKDMQEEYLKVFPAQRGKYRLEMLQVINWMTQEKRYADELEFYEVHLGSYWTADFSLSHSIPED